VQSVFCTRLEAEGLALKLRRGPIKNRANVTGGTPGWKQALNSLTMYCGDRITLN
jgi:hypothetical protein